MSKKNHYLWSKHSDQQITITLHDWTFHYTVIWRDLCHLLKALVMPLFEWTVYIMHHSITEPNCLSVESLSYITSYLVGYLYLLSAMYFSCITIATLPLQLFVYDWLSSQTANSEFVLKCWATQKRADGSVCSWPQEERCMLSWVLMQQICNIMIHIWKMNKRRHQWNMCIRSHEFSDSPGEDPLKWWKDYRLNYPWPVSALWESFLRAGILLTEHWYRLGGSEAKILMFLDRKS
jgi:hypothetical protein